ncbi:MAG TPA: STAS domain-containing protein [Bacteroidota bacterium]|nr:STAS domain-containing protein [Bacteroidota bacterium]
MFDAKLLDDGRVELFGRFDAAQVEKARVVFDLVKGPATVDFRGLEYISSAGLGILLMTQRRLKEAGGKGLKLMNMNKHIGDVFRYAGFDQVFEIV